MSIRSDPPDAFVFVDGNNVGKTPLETKFTWYGKVNLVVEKPGFKTIESISNLPVSWYQVFPLSIIVDVFVPWNTKDRREFSFKLEPYSAPHDIEELKKGMDDARDKVQK